MPTWPRCALPILFWHCTLFNLFPSSCMTLTFFVNSHWWVPLRVQYPTIYMPFRQIIMYILQCPHDIHVHLFCFDLHKFLLCSRAATCPTPNCGRGTSLFRQELVCKKMKDAMRCLKWREYRSRRIFVYQCRTFCIMNLEIVEIFWGRYSQSYVQMEKWWVFIYSHCIMPPYWLVPPILYRAPPPHTV